MAVQFCGTCGHPLIPDQLFCQHCGSRVDENAPRGAAPAAPGIPVSSGGALYCGECGALVGGQDRVCRRCGAPVEPAPGLGADISLSDAPTVMGTPPPPGNQAPPISGEPDSPGPAYVAQQQKAWGASYSPGPANEPPTFTISVPRPGAQTPPPYRPAGPGGPPRQRWPLVLALVLVALALIAGGSAFLLLRGFGGNQQANGITPTSAPGVTQTPGITPTPGVTPSPTQVVLTPDTASDIIQQYYDYINAKNYDAAYDLFAPELQQMQSRQEFINGFNTTAHDTLTIVNAKMADNKTAEVDVTLQAEQTDGTVKNYAGYYLVTKENGKLLILKGNLQEQ